MDLVTKGTSGGECYGTYNSSTGIGSGAGYVNSCIHSGSTEHSGGPTVWYNYGASTAGTITSTDNTIIATESICPKGWTLPTVAQTRSIGPNAGSTTYVSSFSPVLGGYYENGTLYNESTRGLWWGSTALNGARRYYLYYNGSSLYTGSIRRDDGYYIRCVSEEKDVSDLTYMQDMTPSVAANTAEGTTASLTDRRDGKFSLRSRQPRQEYQWV
ncbi:hypothetical protein IJG93_02930 [Candidatus Saccharibacteria bacterium]|nr:hypothetical protein [Candidatus Saccharibacteria bacterium]